MKLTRGSSRRPSIVAVAITSTLGLAACGDPAPPDQAPAEEASAEVSPAEYSGPGGRIAFSRGTSVQAGDEEKVTYTVDPDGGDLQPLFEDGLSSRPSWSPDGTEISIFCCDDGMAAHLLDPETGEVRGLPPQDPNIETYCGGTWSPDGKRLACESFGADDPKLNGMYSIRSSDGGDLTRITSNPGGTDIPGDYSPDGTRLVFTRWKDELPVGFFVTNVDGSGIQQLTTPNDMMIDDSGFSGSWSPTGDRILIVLRESEAHHKEIWVANADGSSLEQLAITPECGAPFSDPESAGCYSPSWSPDGSKIVFTRSSADGSREDIYIVNADGSGLFQVTDGGGDDNADWGTPPDA